MGRGLVRVGKFDYKRSIQPSTDGYTNVLIHTTGQLSPYTMKDTDGVIMESFWQYSKAWSDVKAQKQPLSKYNLKVIRWEHPAEKHYSVEEGLLPAYWNWRHKGMHHHRWVRYPAGYQDHSKAIGSVIGTPDNYEIVDYIEARKRIYFPKYREIAIETDLFKELKSRLEAGENLQINEVDGPRFVEDEDPYNLVKDGSLEMNEEILHKLMNNPRQPFGHGYCLAALLLDIDCSGNN